ncbi:GIY-YIG nuclease family protein [Novosphingobium umbonatum]|uniref:GIY-YIG nuclease family protein n=1 Tax=Novosphingobium umbonatum TaxID=1908524 RepID=A0A437NB72_9SPHN|nr:GIY-YIG nuclease family protein [Novosphingobium umbonatum]RVU07137.1 GIY-YIG nuclease family protein [Novosphingobium umbonatum]
MTRAIGRSLELYYIDGRPDGMLTAEMFNWTGHVLMTPRTQIATALARPEASYAGIYLLLGEQDGEPLAYIGEGEDISARIRSHDVKKDWWTSAILITAAANKLNKAHVRYLEARLIAEAKSIGRMKLENSVAPSLPGLSEADQGKMEAFLENLLVVLPAVRVDMFIQRARSAPKPATAMPVATAEEPEARFVIENRKHGLTAHASLEQGEFVVEQGSQARLNWASSREDGYGKLHAELKHAGVLVEQDQHCVFAQSYAFQSPSAAAAVVHGRPANGTTEWVNTATRQTYKEWEASRIEAAQASEI